MVSNSTLATYTKISPNRTSPRTHTIDTVTVHCLVGQWTAKQIGDYFANPNVKASPNYGVGKDGSIALCVDERDRSWCSSSASNDHRAVTIEVASDTVDPYAVTDAAYSALINLLADICQRNGIQKLVWSADKTARVNHLNGCNMTVHRDFANKACPGAYLYSKHGDIAAKVNAKLGTAQTSVSLPYTVKVTASTLNIRSGPDVSYAITGYIRDRGTYTIVQESNGWGKLKSGAGWISLAYVKKV